jgi:hypothetical protein
VLLLILGARAKTIMVIQAKNGKVMDVVYHMYLKMGLVQIMKEIVMNYHPPDS